MPFNSRAIISLTLADGFKHAFAADSVSDRRRAARRLRARRSRRPKERRRARCSRFENHFRFDCRIAARIQNFTRVDLSIWLIFRDLLLNPCA